MTEVGQPRDAVNVNLNGKFGAFFINNEVRYLSAQSITAYEDLNAFQGRAPQNQDYASINYYPEVLYLNTRVGITSTRIRCSTSVSTMSPIGCRHFRRPASVVGTGIYDNKGRYFYSGINVRF